MGAGRPPGSTGTKTDTSAVDAGTLRRGESPTPGTFGDRTKLSMYQRVSEALGRLGRDANRSYALGEAATGVHFMSSYIAYVNAKGNVKDELGQGSGVFMSTLGPEMLEDYLRGSLSRELREKVRKEILQAQAWKSLVVAINEAISAETDQIGRPLNGAEIFMIARKTVSLKDYKDPDTGERIYFHNTAADRGLQIVIGGVTKLEVTNCNVMGGNYEIQVVLGDTYDFENDRSDMPAYDQFRKHLAELLISGQYASFWWEYHKTLYGGGTVDRGRVFASFMYAIEKAGFTHPMDWETTLTISGPVPAP